MAAETKLIGLIGGLSPDATWHYYKLLLAACARRNLSLRLLINHADLDQVLDAADRGDEAALVAHLGGLVRELEQAGAALVAISAVTPHLVAPALARQAGVPIIDIVDVLDRALQRQSARRVALLGTRTTLESRFFGRLAATVMDPSPAQSDRIHDLYTTVARRGAEEATSGELAALAEDLTAQHDLDAVILAGTNLSVIPPGAWGGAPVIDCADLHVEAIVAAATP
ncbi:MAG TPA: aspartate/glutamate racemase family protein [Aliidongia sp.]|nr:aspartate/glutamate racemase family protein [Aliidongia sp.]